MPDASLGVQLISSLRRTGSTSALREIDPEKIFSDPVERAAFNWLRDYVFQYRAFPTPTQVRQATTVVTVTTQQPVQFYLDQSRERALYYALMQPYDEMRQAMEGANPQAVLEMAKEMQRVGAGLQRQSSDFVPLDTALDAVMEDYRIARMTSTLRGIPTYWPYVSEITSGWQNDDLISVVGRPGVGKTYFLLLIAYAAWLAGYSVLFGSMELGMLQLARRLFGLHARINPDLIRKGRLSTQISNTLDDRMSGMRNGVPFNIIVGGFRKSVDTFRAVAETTSPDLIVVDASYLLKPSKARAGSGGRREVVSDTIEELKTLALDLRRPVVQSVQFNRNAVPQARRGAGDRRHGNGNGPGAGSQRESPDQDRNNPVAHLSLEKIGETDVIGQASSIVLGIAKPPAPYSEVQRWLAFLKGREGEQGVIKVNYRFNPVNFDMIQIGYDPEANDRTQGENEHISAMM